MPGGSSLIAGDNMFGPILIGGGERLFDNLGGSVHGYECIAFDNLSGVGHARLTRSSQGGA